MTTLAQVELADSQRRRLRRNLAVAGLSVLALLITVFVESDLAVAVVSAAAAALIGFTSAKEVLSSPARACLLVLVIGGALRDVAGEYRGNQEEQFRAFAQGVADGLRKSLASGACPREALPEYLQEPGEVFVGMGDDTVVVSIRSSRSSGHNITLSYASGNLNIERTLGLPPCPLGHVGFIATYSRNNTIQGIGNSIIWPDGAATGGSWLGFTPSADSLKFRNCSYKCKWNKIVEAGHIEFAYLLSRGRIPKLDYDFGVELGSAVVESECRASPAG